MFPNWVNRIACFFAGHDVIQIQPLSQWSERVGCVHCLREFAVNHDTRIMLPWTEDFAQFYRSRGVDIR